MWWFSKRSEQEQIRLDTLLIKAVDDHHLGDLLYALKEGADPLARQADRPISIFHAVSIGFLEGVKVLLPSCQPHVVDMYGRSLLARAAREGHTDCLRFLMQHDLDANLLDEQRLSPLMLALDHGHFECAKLLLPLTQHQRVDGFARTLLMHAAYGGNSDCVKLLLAYSNPNQGDCDGETALMIAAKRGKHEAVRVLLPVSDIQAVDQGGWTAKARAIVESQSETVHVIEAYEQMIKERAELAAALASSCDQDTRMETATNRQGHLEPCTRQGSLRL